MSKRCSYSFTGGTDGANPDSGLIRDVQGYLYGTTNLGGAYGKGTVFRINPAAVKQCSTASLEEPTGLIRRRA